MIPNDPMLRVLPLILRGLPILSCSFKSPCDGHDWCYGTCGSDKDECDSLFYDALMTRCKGCWRRNFYSWDPRGLIWLAACNGAAGDYYLAVHLAGHLPHAKAQYTDCEECCCP